jgi:transcriptional regulator with XRE-family HTH domain
MNAAFMLDMNPAVLQPIRRGRYREPPRMDLHDLFGRRLRELRLARGLSQAEVAEGAGVTPEYVSRIECGRAGPSMAAIARLARALGVEAKALFDFGQPARGHETAVERLAYLAAGASGADQRLILRLAESVLGRRPGGSRRPPRGARSQ